MAAASTVATLLWACTTVRAQDLALSVEVPTEQIADWPFNTTTTWETDAARTLSLAMLEASHCGDNLNAGLELDRTAEVVVEETVSGAGSRVDEVTLVRRGTYLACAYLQSNPDPAAPADLVAQSPWPIEITTFPGTTPTAGIACGDVGGPRHIRRVRAFSVRCRLARRVARRWGRAEDGDSSGAYRCRTRGRKVRCTASGGRTVTFRYR